MVRRLLDSGWVVLSKRWSFQDKLNESLPIARSFETLQLRLGNAY